MQSIWSDSIQLPQFPRLQRDQKTDVLIIGGGLAGILCAYMLQKSGIDYMLVEAKRICSGITKNTTAKITVQHGLIYHKLIKNFGIEKAFMYLRANQDALEQYRQLCAHINCDFKEQNAFVYTRDDRKKIEKEARALQCFGFEAKYMETLALPFAICGALCFNNQAQFHPLKFIKEIVRDLHVYEKTKAIELNKNIVVTNGGTITADKIIVATHFPFLNKHGSYFLKMYQHRSYVLAVEHTIPIEGMLVDEKQDGLSFRNHKNVLLVGGGSHRTGKSGGNWRVLREFVKDYYPDGKECCAWATQDCMTLDSVPYIGQYSKHTPNLYVATGFNKWGMTSSMVAARILTDRIIGKNNPYASVFSPSRTMLRPQLVLNAFESVANLLYPSSKRCPHLGCALKWNEDERSWDCPCHGSRFQANGELIDNPATDDLKRK